MKKFRLYFYLTLLLCSSLVHTISAQCDPGTDNIPPNVICANDLVINLVPGQGFTLFPTDLDAGSWDDCTPQSDLIINMYSDANPQVAISMFQFSPGTNGTYAFSLEVIDQAGNTTVCDAIVNVNSISNCDPDADPPVAVCDQIILLAASPDDITITPDMLDDGSWDNCTSQADLDFFITADLFATTVPSTNSYTYPGGFSGIDSLALWVVDAAGNSNVCITAIEISDCGSITALPSATCNTSITYSYNPAGYTITPLDVLEGIWQQCTFSQFDMVITLDTDLTVIPTTTSVTLPADTSGLILVAVWVTDNFGNYSVCLSEIFIEQDPAICANDIIAPVAVCEAYYTITTTPGSPYTIDAEQFDDGSYDDCSDVQFYVTLDGSLTAPPSSQSITFPENTNATFDVYLWVVDAAGNFNTCVTEVEVNTFQFFFGQAFVDDNQNCNLDSLENGIENLIVRYSLNQGMSYDSVFTNNMGIYSFSESGFINANEILVEILLPLGLTTNCPTIYTLPFPANPNPQRIDFPIQLAADCDYMTVDISTPFLRRCFPSPYSLNYCNRSAYDIDDVEILLTLPAEMIVDNTSWPYTDLGNDQYLFELGTVSAGSCSSISLLVILDCTVPLGATKCVQAEISPNTCNTAGANWSGAHLEITANCNEDTDKIEFTITNTGTGAMSQALDYIVIEDVIMYMQNPIQLGVGQSELLEFPANGSTWRLEMDQEPGHPSLSNPSVTVEGCTEYGSMGFVNQFSTPDVDPYLAIDCQEVIGSYDPNDKRAFPEGYSEAHYIKENTSIEYNIRFQNTGTDTAFTVRIEDQISPTLDFSTIELGASSHPCRLEVRQDNKLIFHFAEINLPDSTTNEIASHGFVQFRIQQKLDNPIGTLIENTADIYFDFNEAIQTNTTFHTVGEDFVIINSTQAFDPNLALTIAPNPFTTQTVFTLKGVNIETGHFELYDLFGRLVKQDKFSNNQYRLVRETLPAGTYIFQFHDGEKLLANGKLVVF